jgi:L-aminopeptidase/D-esterase-like protein
VKEEHVAEALRTASDGPVAEGSVGGGTGAVCFGFKGGIGTSSRRVAVGAGTYMLGALVQCNGGRKEQLTIAGAPVGREIPERPAYDREAGSIVIVIATDAPLLPHQLERVARRGAMGLARLGATSGNGSGDFVLAFSTANAVSRPSGALQSARYLPNGELDAVFEAAVQATEEAIVNALVAAVTMTGADGNVAIGLPHDALKAALAKYNRLAR